MRKQVRQPNSPHRPSFRTSNGVVQSKRACESIKRKDGACSNRDVREKSQFTANSDLTATEVPTIVHDVLRTPGRSLDLETKSFMEPRFGRDFSHVRLHTDSLAVESANAVNAHAYTVGNHIVIPFEKYSMSTPNGRSLIAHELAHTIQQSGVPLAAIGEGIRESSNDALENEARFVGVSINNSSRIKVNGRVDAPILQRATAQDLLDANLENSRAGRRRRRGMPSGTIIHRFILTEFMRSCPEAIRPFRIPGASSGGNRVDVPHDPAVIPRQVFDESGGNGYGTPDLAARIENDVVEVAEIKPASHTLISDGERQLQNYIEVGKSQANETWRASGSRRGFRIAGFEAMRPQRFLRESPLNVSGVPISIAWFKEGLLLYEWIQGSELPQNEETEREPYIINVANQSLTFHLGAPMSDGPGNTFALNDSVNEQTAKSIPGMQFIRIQKMARADKVWLGIREKSTEVSSGLGITIAPVHRIVEVVLNHRTRELSQVVDRRRRPFEFPLLSPGDITSLSFSPDRGLSGEGVIRPTIPLLRGAELRFRFDGNSMVLSAPIPTNRLRGIPGFRVKDASLDFQFSPEFIPSGSVAFDIGPARQPFAEGRVEVTADSEGFLARGTMNARVPGFDSSQANVTYRPQTGWQGTVSLTTSKSYVRSANITLGLSDQGLSASGGVEVALPGDQTIGLLVEKRRESLVFCGSGRFQLPGDRFEPIQINFEWDGENIEGTGETGFTFRGFRGHLSVVYRDGRVSGQGTLQFQKGKARGRLNIRLSPTQKLSGDGEVTYQLTESLLGTVGVEIDEQEKVKLKGALEFTRPIPLFRPFGGERELFSIGVSIPIPGASIGPVGVKARIEGSLTAGFNIGPGELRRVRLETMLNPLEDDPNLNLRFSGQLFIGAGARVTGTIQGGIMLDAVVASATGGLSVSATAALDGHASADTVFEYSQDHVSVEGNLDVLLRLILTLTLDAVARAEAGVGPFSTSTEKRWNLASYSFDPGLHIGLRTKSPLRYDSRQGLQTPSLEDIEIIKPNIDVQDMMSRIFARGSRPEVPVA